MAVFRICGETENISSRRAFSHFGMLLLCLYALDLGLVGGKRPLPLNEAAEKIGVAQAHLSRCLDAEKPPGSGKIADFLSEIGVE